MNMHRASVLVGLVVGAVTALGCNGPFETGTIPDQLEPLAIDAVEEQSGGALGATGMVRVVPGADRSFRLSVGELDLALDLDIHSPGNSPIELLDGRMGEVSATEPGEGGRSLVVKDDAGPVYIAALGDTYGLSNVEKLLGKDFVSYGDELGQQGDGTFIWTYKKGVFKTDKGDVALLPGEVQVIEIDGVSWRAVLNVAYEVSTDPTASALPGCAPDSMLGFEMIRVEDPQKVELSKVARLAGAKVAYVGCTAPGGDAEE